MRRKCFNSVVTPKIYPSISTDVLCVGEDLPLADDRFDKVISLPPGSLHPLSYAREMCRVLKPGGEMLIDYPFMQHVNGYPHHYFNATPQGHRSLFEELCDIKSVEVRPNQAPIYSLFWILQLWKSGLSAADAARFGDLRIKDILAGDQARQAEEFYCKNLSPQIQNLIAAGSTLIGSKKMVTGCATPTAGCSS